MFGRRGRGKEKGLEGGVGGRRKVWKEVLEGSRGKKNSLKGCRGRRKVWKVG